MPKPSEKKPAEDGTTGGGGGPASSVGGGGPASLVDGGFTYNSIFFLNGNCPISPTS